MAIHFGSLFRLLRRLTPPRNDVFIKKITAMDNVTNFSSIDYSSKYN
ncbi:hypothetical protein [Candidatus Tisiphia endosymbiont of Sialis lutaria]